MKSRSLQSIVLIVILAAAPMFAQQESTLYLGVGGGLTYVEAGFSRFGFRLNGAAHWRWTQQSAVSASLSRLYVLDLSWPGNKSNYGQSRFERFEITYSNSLVNLFQTVRLGASTGISYNMVRYFKDDNALLANSVTTTSTFGIPIGALLTNALGGSIYGGLDYKWHVIAKHTPYGELGFFLSFAVI